MRWFGLEFGFRNYETIKKDFYNIDAFSIYVAPKFNYWINNRVSVYTKIGLEALSYDTGVRQEDSYFGVLGIGGVGTTINIVHGVNVDIEYMYGSGEVEQAESLFSVAEAFDITSQTLALKLWYQF